MLKRKRTNTAAPEMDTAEHRNELAARLRAARKRFGVVAVRESWTRQNQAIAEGYLMWDTRVG